MIFVNAHKGRNNLGRERTTRNVLKRNSVDINQMPVEEATTIRTSPQPTFNYSFFHVVVKVTMCMQPINGLIKCHKNQAFPRQFTWGSIHILCHYLGNATTINMLFGTTQKWHVKLQSVILFENRTTAALVRPTLDRRDYSHIPPSIMHHQI